MATGSIRKRCTSCGRTFGEVKRCRACGSASYSWTITYDRDPGADGKRRQQTEGRFATRREAERRLAEVGASMQRGAYVEPSNLTVATFLVDEWLPAIEATVRASTFFSYSGHVRRHVVPRIGGLRLQDLTGGRLNAFYATLLSEGRRDGSSLAPATVRRVYATLHRALGDAVRWGRLVRNPADAADPPQAASQSDKKVWTASELERFLGYLEGDRLRPAFLVAALTGMRRGEVLGLRWDDLDLDAGYLSVRRSRTCVGYEVRVEPPKTKRGERRIDLGRRTVATLRAWRKAQLEERLSWGEAWSDTGYVFTREDGAPVHPDRFSKLFARTIREAGLPRIPLKNLRHTHATLLLKAGVHPKVVQERLGHASIAITLDTYSSVSQGMQAEAAELGETAVFGD
jgi:integrase